MNSCVIQNRLSCFMIGCCVLFSACNHNYQSEVTYKDPDPLADVFIDANKQMIINEERKIDSLLSFSDFSFTRHETGIRTLIDSSINLQKHERPIDGDNVLIAYNCVVFEKYNDVVDNSFIDTLSFKIGYSKQMRGLNYAIKLLQIGDKAKIIIPSYLGFGMSGYGKSVPPYSTLLLNIKLLNIEK